MSLNNIVLYCDTILNEDTSLDIAMFTINLTYPSSCSFKNNHYYQWYILLYACCLFS